MERGFVGRNRVQKYQLLSRFRIQRAIRQHHTIEAHKTLRNRHIRHLRNETRCGRRNSPGGTSSEKIVAATGWRSTAHRLSPHNDLDQKIGLSIQDRSVED